MYKQAYELIREILEDASLNDYILDETGKHLALIEAGAKISVPSASIYFSGGAYTRRSNSSSEIAYTVSFALPFWGADAFTRCLDFVDFIVPVFFDYKDKHNFILSAEPSINEVNEEGSQLWTVDFLLTVSAFM